jgi:hypothetical protein
MQNSKSQPESRFLKETRFLNSLPTHPTAAVAESLGASPPARLAILLLPALQLTTV